MLMAANESLEFSTERGHRKAQLQKDIEDLDAAIKKHNEYRGKLYRCGSRNSYSKTDPDATFMRIKKDYMGNDQLLPAYNLQTAVCDEYIAMFHVFQFASDMDCFQPLMDKFNSFYDFYHWISIFDRWS